MYQVQLLTRLLNILKRHFTKTHVKLINTYYVPIPYCAHRPTLGTEDTVRKQSRLRSYQRTAVQSLTLSFIYYLVTLGHSRMVTTAKRGMYLPDVIFSAILWNRYLCSPHFTNKHLTHRKDKQQVRASAQPCAPVRQAVGPRGTLCRACWEGERRTEGPAGTEKVHSSP